MPVLSFILIAALSNGKWKAENIDMVIWGVIGPAKLHLIQARRGSTCL